MAVWDFPEGGNATEDPPFGGLWCDQPALFLPPRLPKRQLHWVPEGFTFPPMDGTQEIHRALVTVQHAVTTMSFPSCDQGDLIELIDRVEEELHSPHPNLGLMGNFLNSIARSLRAQPEAREVCLVIEDAIGAAGITSTWQSGI